MNRDELDYLNKNKINDKEWNLLSTENNVEIITIDDIDNLPSEIKLGFKEISRKPLKGLPLKKYKELIKRTRVLLENKKCKIITV